MFATWRREPDRFSELVAALEMQASGLIRAVVEMEGLFVFRGVVLV